MSNVKTNNIALDLLVSRVEKMIDGLKAHPKDKLPVHLDAAARARELAQLKTLRREVLAAQKELSAATGQFRAAFSTMTRTLSRDADSLRGYFGKSNDVLGDFGVKIYVPPRGGRNKPRKKPAAAVTPAAPEPAK